MRKIFGVLAVPLIASLAFAAPAERGANRGERDLSSRMSWVKRAPIASEAELRIEAQDALADVAGGSRPIVLVETNYYTYLPGEPLQVRVTLHPNGFSSAATLYLYRENRTTGEKRYYNIAGGGLLAAGQSADLFGSQTSPVAVVLPTLSDFVLLGSSGDAATIGWGANGALGSSITVPTGQTGLYQWVFEIRDAAGRRVVSRSNAMFSYIESSENVTGQLTASATWTANKRYILNDFVGVVDPAVLTIEPGTVIYGGDSRATLFVQRGAKIVADGTARRPIIFTSAQKVGDRAQRDWGGLVLLGRSVVNEPGGQGVMEGLTQTQYAFGGTDVNDSSGVVRYVRLEFGGFPIELNQEINGITLAGVGRGTTVEYVEVLHNKDDAFEFFGGTVDARYLLSVAAADDTIDWDLGYIGNIQFVASVKRGVNDENDGNILIEADGHPQTHTLTPESNPLVFNITGIGTGRTDVGAYGNVLRRGTAGRVYNAIVTGSRFPPLTIRDDATFNNATQGELIIDNSILTGNFADAAFTNSADRGELTRNFLFQTMLRNRNVDPQLAIGAPSHIKTLMPDLTPQPGSAALDLNYVATPPDNRFFKQVDFLGAVDPGDNWILSGWANFSDN